MEPSDISLASSSATMDQVDAIKRRSASGNVGTAPMPGRVVHALDDDQPGRRPNLLDYLMRWPHRDCD